MSTTGFKGGKYGLQYRTKEEVQEIVKKSKEQRKKNTKEKMMLQKCMQTLLALPVVGEHNKVILQQFGFSDPDHDNKTLLMVALFKKGLSGDVSAIKEITDMMDKLDIYQETKKLQGNVTVNILPVGAQYVTTEADEEAIRKAQEDSGWMDDEKPDTWDIGDIDDDWGEEVYKG